MARALRFSRDVVGRGTCGALLALVAVACSDNPSSSSQRTGGTPPPATTPGPTPTVAPGSVRVADAAFVPGELTVQRGTTVRWEWTAGTPHSLQGLWDGKRVDSGEKVDGDSFSLTFDKPGTFDYTCGVRGRAMSGRVVVVE